MINRNRYRQIEKITQKIKNITFSGNKIKQEYFQYALLFTIDTDETSLMKAHSNISKTQTGLASIPPPGWRKMLLGFQNWVERVWKRFKELFGQEKMMLTSEVGLTEGIINLRE